MKIAYIIPSLARKGPILVVKDIVDNLVGNALIDEIVVFYFDDIVEVEFRCLTKQIKFIERIDFDKFDIIHSHMLRPDMYIFINKMLGNIKTAKTISTLHQYNYKSLKNDLNNKYVAYIASKIWNLLLSSQDMVVCLSQDMKTYYEKQLFLNKNKLTYVYNGRPEIRINDNEDTEIFINIPRDSIVIGTSCLLTPRKGLEQVINVLPKINNLYFVVLGSGREEEKLKKLARSLNVDKRCIFLGFKHNPYIYYKHFDIFILPSRSEGFPLALIEAASMKKAIIASDLPIFRETWQDGEIVFFKLDDLDDLKNKILEAYENRYTLSEKAYQKYLEEYTAKKMADKYLLLYNKLLSK